MRFAAFWLWVMYGHLAGLLSQKIPIVSTAGLAVDRGAASDPLLGTGQLGRGVALGLEAAGDLRPDCASQSGGGQYLGSQYQQPNPLGSQIFRSVGTMLTGVRIR